MIVIGRDDSRSAAAGIAFARPANTIPTPQKTSLRVKPRTVLLIVFFPSSALSSGCKVRLRPLLNCPAHAWGAARQRS